MAEQTFKSLFPLNDFYSWEKNRLDEKIKYFCDKYPQTDSSQIVRIFCKRLCEYYAREFLDTHTQPGEYISSESDPDNKRLFLLDFYWSKLDIPKQNPFFKDIAKMKFFVKVLVFSSCLMKQTDNSTFAHHRLKQLDDIIGRGQPSKTLIENLFGSVDSASDNWQPIVEEWLIHYIKQAPHDNNIKSSDSDSNLVPQYPDIVEPAVPTICAYSRAL